MRVQRSLHPGQTKAWRSERRFVAAIAGTGGGKTWFGPIWLYREIQEHPKGDFLVAAPTYGMLQRITQPEFRKFIEEMIPGVWEAGYKEKDRTLYLPTGGRVFFGSADNPVTLEGVHVHAVWLDEAGQMKRMIWDVATRRVGHKKGRILITTTPYNLGWLKLEVYDRWKAGDQDYDVITFPSYWNPTYPRDEYERARRTLPAWKFNMFYRGKFARPLGLVYQDFDPQVHLIDPFPIPREWRRYIGVDFGWNNPTAAIWLAVDHDGVGYLYREYYEVHKHPEESGQDLLDLSVTVDGEPEDLEAVFCDPENPEAIDKYSDLGLPVEKAFNPISEGITEVIKLYRAHRLFIFKGLVNLLDEMENYVWKKQATETGEGLKDVPVDEYNHACDGKRYVVNGWIRSSGSGPMMWEL